MLLQRYQDAQIFWLMGCSYFYSQKSEITLILSFSHEILQYNKPIFYISIWSEKSNNLLRSLVMISLSLSLLNI
jgi:hypothetical protein